MAGAVEGNEIIYGPVRSRRLGYSLGVNVTPRRGKTCNFDCVYCQYGRTSNLISSSSEIEDWVDPHTTLRQVEMLLQRLGKEERELNSITFSGYGEPTLYPHLKDVVRDVKKLRDEHCPGVRVDILTNSSNIRLEGVFEALREFDSVMAKLDAGSQNLFEAINRPAIGVPPLEDMIGTLARIQDATGRVTLQTLIFRSTDPRHCDNSSLDEIRHVAEKACLINPVEVQVYTVARRPSESFVEPIEERSMWQATSLINDLMGKRCAKAYF